MCKHLLYMCVHLNDNCWRKIFNLLYNLPIYPWLIIFSPVDAILSELPVIFSRKAAPTLYMGGVPYGNRYNNY